jgi:hypothetical protein
MPFSFRASPIVYMINNMSPGFLPNGVIDSANILTGAKVPPSSLRTRSPLSHCAPLVSLTRARGLVV